MSTIYGNTAYSIMKAQNNKCFLENLEFVEFESGNFSNLLDSLDVLTENNLITLNEGKVIEFLKDKWEKFVQWIKDIWKKIKEFFNNIKTDIIKKKLQHAWNVIDKYSNSKELDESTIIKEDVEQVDSNGNIIIDCWEWGIDREQQKDGAYNMLEEYLTKDRKINIPRIISEIEAHLLEKRLQL